MNGLTQLCQSRANYSCFRETQWDTKSKQTKYQKYNSIEIEFKWKKIYQQKKKFNRDPEIIKKKKKEILRLEDYHEWNENALETISVEEILCEAEDKLGITGVPGGEEREKVAKSYLKK